MRYILLKEETLCNMIQEMDDLKAEKEDMMQTMQTASAIIREQNGKILQLLDLLRESQNLIKENQNTNACLVKCLKTITTS